MKKYLITCKVYSQIEADNETQAHKYFIEMTKEDPYNFTNNLKITEITEKIDKEIKNKQEIADLTEEMIEEEIEKWKGKTEKAEDILESINKNIRKNLEDQIFYLNY